MRAAKRTLARPQPPPEQKHLGHDRLRHGQNCLQAVGDDLECLVAGKFRGEIGYG